MGILRLENLVKVYENKKNKTKNVLAVDSLSLECRDGEFIGILGPSGCGKTTTLRMIAGLEDITSGSIYIDDVKINDTSPEKRNIGLAFENYALYPPLTVYNNIAFCLRAKKIHADEIDKRVKEIAPLLKIEDFLDKKPEEISGGQKQRVNIARALIRKPKLLLLDEPLSHLDGKMRQKLRLEIRRIQREIRCTSIIVTHDQIEAMSLSDRIAIMNNGRLQQYGTPYEVYSKPVNEFVAGFIGEPPMNIFTVVIEEYNGALCFAAKPDGLYIPVPEECRQYLKPGMEIRLGVRPADIYIGSPDSPGSPIPVAVVEDLCEEKRISVSIQEKYLTLSFNGELKHKVGDMIKLSVKGDKTHMFDVDTGDRIG